MCNIIPFELLFFPLTAIEVVLVFGATLVLVELRILFLVIRRTCILHDLFLIDHKISYQPWQMWIIIGQERS